MSERRTTAGVRRLSLAEAEKSPGWARLCGSDDLFASPQWFPIERSGSGPWVPTANDCLAVTDGDRGRLVAGLTLQRFGESTEDGLLRVDKMLAPHPAFEGVPGDTLSAGLLPALMAGGWFNSRIMEADGLSGSSASAARREIIDECVRVGLEWECAAVFFPFLDAANNGLRDDLRDAGFVEATAPVRYVFDSDYPSYDEYFRHVLRKRHRVRIRKERREFYQTGAVTRRASLDRSNVRQIAGLAHNLERKYGHSSTLVQVTDWFTTIMEHNRTTVFTATLGERLFAMDMWIHRHDRVYAFHCGFDYEISKEVPHAYSVIGYRLPIVWACSDPEIRFMEHGVGTDEAKISRGCYPVPQVLSVKALSGAAQELLATLPAEAAGTEAQ